mmetsp:Transcript_129444/g.374883  ORF Transcript_129444/g.374883 Transcript_129444/m.374883 type:complete len:255 (-) Transcript_129444:139-903(-)
MGRSAVWAFIALLRNKRQVRHLHRVGELAVRGRTALELSCPTPGDLEHRHVPVQLAGHRLEALAAVGARQVVDPVLFVGLAELPLHRCVARGVVPRVVLQGDVQAAAPPRALRRQLLDRADRLLCQGRLRAVAQESLGGDLSEVLHDRPSGAIERRRLEPVVSGAPVPREPPCERVGRALHHPEAVLPRPLPLVHVAANAPHGILRHIVTIKNSPLLEAHHASASRGERDVILGNRGGDRLRMVGGPTPAPLIA